MPSFSKMPVYRAVDRSYAYVQKTAKLCDLWEDTKLFCFQQKGAVLPASGTPMMSLEKRCGKPMLFSHHELSSSLARYFFLSVYFCHKGRRDLFYLERGKSFSDRNSKYMKLVNEFDDGRKHLQCFSPLHITVNFQGI